MANKKAAKGSGTIRKKEVIRNGKPYIYWEARLTTGRDPGTGKQMQRSITGKTQKEVREKLQQIAVELNTGSYLEPSRMTVKDWLTVWLTEYTGDLKTLTQSSYENQVKNHINPGIGAIRLQSLTAVNIQKMYNDFQRQDKPLSPKSIKNVHGVLHKALQQAVELGYIKFNPSDACKLPRVEKTDIKPLEDVQIAQFLQAIQGNPFERLFTVDIFTGLRQGEILGLRWDDIDFKGGTILVRQQLIRNRKEKEYQLAPLKNDKARRITPAPTVMQMLRDQKKNQTEQRLKAGPAWNDNGLVFTDEQGNNLVYQTIFRHFKKAVAKIGSPDTRFHDLRHSYAVASLQSGDDIKTVQENLGHHTAAFTMDVYGHVSEKMKKDSSDRMERFIQGVKTG